MSANTRGFKLGRLCLLVCPYVWYSIVSSYYNFGCDVESYANNSRSVSMTDNLIHIHIWRNCDMLSRNDFVMQVSGFKRRRGFHEGSSHRSTWRPLDLDAMTLSGATRIARL